MHIMDIPQIKRKKDYAHWRDEILGYIRKLEKLTGNRVTEASLHDAIVLLNKKRRVLQRAALDRATATSYVSGFIWYSTSPALTSVPSVKARF